MKTAVKEEKTTIESVKMKLSTLRTLYCGYTGIFSLKFPFFFYYYCTVSRAASQVEVRVDWPLMLILLSSGAGHLPARYLHTEMGDAVVHTSWL